MRLAPLALAFLTLSALGAPTPAQATVSPQEATEWRPRFQAAKQFARSRSTDVSFELIDMRGRTYGLSGRRSYIMASTFKVMLLAAYLRQDSVRSRDLTRDERQLLGPMIRNSKNSNAAKVRDMLGPGPVESLANAAEMDDFAYNSIWGYCRASARDGALLMRGFGRLVPARHRTYALRLLASIEPDHRWGVAKVPVPQGWRVHFKGGWGLDGFDVEHQVALLQNGSRRVAISVLTQGNPSRKYGRNTLLGVFTRLLRDLPR